jgi:hypothetical protein
MFASMETVRPLFPALIRHVVLPAAAPTAVTALYFTPVAVFGCVNRGLMALSVVLLSTLAACVTTSIGARARARHDPSVRWWLLTTLILLLPIALVVGPLG